MVDRLMKEWEVWSQEQTDAATTAADDAVEAAPPALTVRGEFLLESIACTFVMRRLL